MMIMQVSNPQDVFHAIADPNRRRLLDLLLREERSVQELVPHFDVTIGAISQHLKVLLECGLVVRRKEGRYRFYRTRPEALKQVHDWTGHYRAFWESRFEQLAAHLREEP